MVRAWRFGLIVGAMLAATDVAPAPTAAQSPAPPFQEFAETFKAWKLYCQVWSDTKRVECELGSRTGSDRKSRLVWLRSTERWMEGLRLRLDGAGTDLDKGVRIWVDNALIRPESSCKPFAFESGTCTIPDPATNHALVDKMLTGKGVTVVGQTPDGAKSEIRFSLTGFKEAVERMEQIRRGTGSAWM
jgi:Invasion protein B, involved in pathogenesis